MNAVVREAWSTLVPDMNGRHGPLPPLLLGLTVVTGLVDAFSYLVLGHVFVANMTGNVVFSGFAIAGAAGFSLTASVVALATFAVGALAGGRITRAAGPQRARILHQGLLVQTVLVIAAYLLAQLAAPTTHGPAVRYALIAMLGIGMGLQNAVVRTLAVPDLTTTVLTMTVTGTAADSRLAGGSGSKGGRRMLSAAAMFLGGLLGALAVLHGHSALPLLLAALMLAAATAVTRPLSRSDAAWTQPV